MDLEERLRNIERAIAEQARDAQREAEENAQALLKLEREIARLRNEVVSPWKREKVAR